MVQSVLAVSFFGQNMEVYANEAEESETKQVAENNDLKENISEEFTKDKQEKHNDIEEDIQVQIVIITMMNLLQFHKI
ncbi:hypothetical protein RBH29_01170 [Herbivorax sp. ANBcel31]|uniref:hypothetical protein n=1 Tax=Herbivorax sp. ANBcel31 TaxID=3069754 RepID=UPI0027B09118|nr:hypothetical protein [Herbivorax sp. ANBcel31]MDQ2085048.1 hypothetical protein [Herbivorax sp. ANBcel31]